MAEIQNMDAIIQMSRADGVTWDPEANEPVPEFMLVYDEANRVIKQGNGIDYFEDLPDFLNFNDTDEVREFYNDYFDKTEGDPTHADKLLYVNAMGTRIKFTDIKIDDLVTQSQLDAIMAGKSNLAHGHAADQMLDGGTAAIKNVGINPGNVVAIGGNGKLPADAFGVNSALDKENSDILSFLLLSRMTKNAEDQFDLPSGIADEFIDFTGIDPALCRDYAEGNECVDMLTVSVADSWEQLADGPVQRYSFGDLTKIGSKLYLYGGYDGSDYYNDTWEYDTVTGVWTQKANGPAARASFVTAELDNKMYVFGGYVTGTGYVSEVWEYNPETDAWAQRASMAVVNSKMQIAVYDDRAIIVGGSNGGTRLNRCDVYNPHGNQWANKASAPRRISHGKAFMYGNYMYVIGGFDESTNTSTDVIMRYHVGNNVWDTIPYSTDDTDARLYDHAGALIDGYYYIYGGISAPGSRRGLIWRYNPRTDVWEKVTPNHNYARRFCSMVNVGGQLHVYGGMYDNTVIFKEHLVFHIHDRDSKYIFDTTKPSRRGYLTPAKVGDEIYIIGGFTLTYGSSNQTLDDVWAYNVVTKTWTQKNNFPSEIGRYSIGVYNGKIYVVGGYRYNGPTTGIIQEVWEYNPGDDSWTQKNDAPIEPYLATSAVVGSKLYVIGGQRTGDKYSKKANAYDMATDTWEDLADIPIGYQSGAAAVVDGEIYLVGGRREAYDYNSRFFKYTPGTDTWTELTAMPDERSYNAAFAYNGNVYMYAGLHYPNEPILGALWEYNVAKDRWTVIDNVLPDNCAIHGMMVDDTYMVFGGYDNANNYINDHYTFNMADILSDGFVTSIAYEAAAEPNDARLFMRAELGDKAVLNVDAIAEVTRDGANWRPVKLEELPMVDGVIKCYAGDADFTKSAFEDTYSWINAEREDLSDNIGTFVIDVANLSGHFDNPINERILPGCIIKTANASLIIKSIEAEGKLTNQVIFEGVATKGSYPLEGIYGLTTDGKLAIAERYETEGVWDDGVDYNGRLVSTAIIDDKLYIHDGYGLFDSYDLVTGEWESLTPANSKSTHACMVAIDGKLYHYGGHNGSTPSNVLRCYTPSTDTWETKAAGSPLQLVACCAINGKMYVAGGTTHAGVSQTTARVYDPATNTWSNIAAFPLAIGFTTAVAYDGKMWVHGGHTLNGSTHATMYAYDPDTNTWEKKADGPKPRMYHGTAVYNDKIYIYGGKQHGGAEYTDLQEYDPATDMWTEIRDDLPGGLMWEIEAVGNILYIPNPAPGGYSYKLSTYQIDQMIPVTREGSSVEVTDVDYIDQNVWEAANGALPEGLYSSNIAIVGTDIYLFGGSADGVIYPNSFFKYDTVADEVTDLTAHTGPTMRYGHGMTAYGTDVYLFGGYDGNYRNDLWKFDTLTNTWSQVSVSGGPSIRYFIPLCEHNGKLYTLGGRYGSTHYEDLWEYDIAGNTWTQKASCGTGCLRSILVSYGDEMLAIIPQTASGKDDVSKVYSFTNNTWTSKITIPFEAYGGSSWRIGSKVYYIGGDGGVAGDDNFASFDFGTKVWTELTSTAPEVTSRKSGFGAYIGGFVYLIGGVIEGTYPTEISKGTIYQIPVHTTIHKGTRFQDPWEVEQCQAGARWQPQMVAVGTKIYIGGGYSPGSNEVSNDWKEYDTTTGVWTEKTAQPVPRYAGATAVVGGKIYVDGGLNTIGQYLDDLWEYDPATDTWTELTNPGYSARANHTACVYNGEIYYFGGFLTNVTYSNGCWKYNPSTQQFTALAGYTFGLGNHVAEFINGKMYVFAGRRESDTLYSDSFLMYDPVTDAWSTINTAIPELVGHQHHSAVVNNKMYIFGGYTGIQNGSIYKECYVFDPSIREVTRTQDMYQGFRAGRAVAVGSKIYGFSGIQEDSTVAAEFRILDTTKLNWRKVVKGFNIPKRNSHTSVLINGKIYIHGGIGEDSSYLKDVWEYDPDTDTAINMSDAPIGRQGHTAVAINGKMYVYGGKADGIGAAADCWEYNPATDTWTEKNSCSQERQYQIAAAVNSKMYVFCGTSGGGSFVSSAHMFNPELNTWTTLASTSFRLKYSTAIAVDGKIYVCAGEDHNGNIRNELREYDPDTDSWTTLADCLSTLFQHAMTAADGKLYVFGGRSVSGGDSLKSLYAYDISGNAWEQLDDGFDIIRTHTMTADGTKLYAICGHNGDMAVRSLYRFDILAGNVWSSVGTPIPRRNHRSAVVGSDIYVMGGYNHDLEDLYLGDFWKFNTVTETWTRLKDHPIDTQSGAMEAYNGKLYYAGGYGSGGGSNRLDVYDPVTDEWTQLASMDHARYNNSSTMYNGKFYICAGRDGSGAKIADLIAYDFETNTWDYSLANCPIASNTQVGFVIGGTWYQCSGHADTIGYHSHVFAYDFSTDTWTQKNDMPRPAAIMKGLAKDGKGYIFGGYTPSATEWTILEYTPLTDTWMEIGVMYQEQRNHTVDLIDGNIWSIFGYDSSAVHKDSVWTTALELGYHPTHYSAILDIDPTNYEEVIFTDIIQKLNDEKIGYAFRYDDNTFDIYDNNEWNTIVRNNAGTWQFYDIDKATWANAIVNGPGCALSQAHEVNNYDYIDATEMATLSGLREGKMLNGLGVTLSGSLVSPEVSNITIKGTEDLGIEAPHGTDVRWRLRSSGKDDITLHGVRLKWSE